MRRFRNIEVEFSKLRITKKENRIEAEDLKEEAENLLKNYKNTYRDRYEEIPEYYLATYNFIVTKEGNGYSVESPIEMYVILKEFKLDDRTKVQVKVYPPSKVKEIKEFHSKIDFFAPIIIKEPKTAAGRSRKKDRVKGLICPFCKAKLNRARYNRKEINGKYKIRCSRKNCNFVFYFSEEAYKLWSERKMKTKTWIKEVVSRKCPKCKSEVFKVTIPDEPEYYICKKALEEPQSCSYKEKAN